MYVGNLGTRFGARSAWFLAPTILAVLGLGGITVPAVLDVRSREVEVAVVRARVEHSRSNRERLEVFRRSGGFEQLESALSRLREALPTELGALEVFSAIRLIAAAAEVDLEFLAIGDVDDLGFGDGVESIAMREVSASGHAALPALMGFLTTLRSFGYPSAVLEVSISRSDSWTDVFEFQLELGFFYFTSGAGGRAGDPLAGGGYE